MWAQSHHPPQGQMETEHWQHRVGTSGAILLMGRFGFGAIGANANTSIVPKGLRAPQREGNPPCWDSAHILHPSGSYWSIPIASLCCVTLRHRLHAVPSAVQGKSPLWSTAQPGSGGHAAPSSSELWAMGPRPPPLISNPRPLHTRSIRCHQAETSAPPRRNWSSAQH